MSGVDERGPLAPQESLGEPAGRRTFELPAGVLRRDGQACRRVHVRALTGADEECLFERGDDAGSPSARVSAFLARAIDAIDGYDGPIDVHLVAGMQVGDRDYLLLRLRQVEHGDAVHQVMRCPACRQKVDVDFAISELPVRRLTSPAPAFSIELGGMPAQVRLPTGADQQAVEAIALRNPSAANTLLFSRVVLQLDGRTPTEAEARTWPPALRAELAAWLEARAPGPDLFLDLACPHCNSDMSYTFDLPAFFFAEQLSGLERLMEEIHILALHYHWSEAAILAMPAPKRQRYLALLARYVAQGASAELQP